MSSGSNAEHVEEHHRPKLIPDIELATAMSFDIFFQPCRFGGNTIQVENPFTGETQTTPENEPLKPAELRAVQTVLKRANARGPDEFGCYVVQLADGGGAEIFGKDLENSCMVALRGMTSDTCQLLFDLLKAGNWVMIPAMEDTAAITASWHSVKNAPDDFPRIVVCHSAAELSVLLSKGVREWERYRDQIRDERQ